VKSGFLTTIIAVLLVTAFSPAARAALTTNSWTDGSSKWETGGNWSLGVPPSTNGQSAIVITNAGGNVVTVDAATVLSNAINGCLTISNLTVSANTLQMTNAGTAPPLRVLNSFIITSGGSVSITNSVLGVGSGSGGLFRIDGTVTLQDGSILATNSGINPVNTLIGDSGIGGMTVSNGTWLARDVIVGLLAGSSGTLRIAGGTNQIFEFLSVGGNANATGAVWMTAGQLVVTNVANNAFNIGSSGVGQMTVSNGTVLARNVIVGVSAGSSGALNIAGGNIILSSNMTVGSSANSTGMVQVTGGTITLSNGTMNAGNDGTLTSGSGTGAITISNADVTATGALLGSSAGGKGQLVLKLGGTLHIPTAPPGCAACGIGWNEGILDGGVIDSPGADMFAGKIHDGEMIVSNGVATFRSAYVGLDSTGSLTMPGGTMTVLSNMVVGDCGASVTGAVVISGGKLFVTNSAGNAVLDIRKGTFTLTSGQLKANTLVMTNSCALFVRGNGNLLVGTVQLDPNLDADGDGIPNGYEQSHGLDPLNAADANEDSDADGFTNLQEFLAGTDPSDPDSSPFRITSIVRTNANVVITWTTAGGTTNVVQVTPGAGNGSYSNNFGNLSPMIGVTGVGITSTNFTDPSGATNSPARYYRVKMMTSQAADDASDAAYGCALCWTNGSNGGIGFSAWKLTGTDVLGGGSNGFFIGSSTNNAGGSLPGIDVGGKSWGIYANNGNKTAAYRTFANGPLLVGQSLLINMDNGYVDGGQTDGFVLRNGNASSSPFDYNVGARFEFLFLGGTNNYAVVDNAGLQYTSVGFTGTGLRLKFTLTGANAYSLQIIDNATSATNTVTGTMNGSGSLDSIAIYNRNAGAGSNADAFFNSLQIISP
jgi:hypothetical protein